MKILSATQFQHWDEATINKGTPAIDLMERAAKACAQDIMAHHHRDELILVLCGMGNNGGDGLALVRLLHQQGYMIKAAVVVHREEFSREAETNYKRLQELDSALITEIREDFVMGDLPADLLLIDAILGTGIKGNIQGWLANFIQQVNALPNVKIAVDLPTGLSADEAPAKDAAILRVSRTLTFQAYKRIMLHPESEHILGKIQVLDIGLDREFILQLPTPFSLLGMNEVRQWLKPISAFAHKGLQGTAHIAAGSEGMSGAALLAGLAAFRVGAGKVIVHTTEGNLLALQIALPEAVFNVSGKKMLQQISWDTGAPLAFGPGVGLGAEMEHTLRLLIEQAQEPLVLDADALHLLSKEPSLLHKLPKQSILTPHVKEYERLFGTFKDSMLRLENARTQAMKFNLFIILKGHFTQIITPKGHVWYNTTGNAGMATAGSGDVLTGMIVGLLAQKYEPLEAAMLAVFLHGVAGDEAARQEGMRSVIARDIIAQIGAAWKRLAS